MFVLTTIKDTVRIPPWQLMKLDGESPLEAVREAINIKYANRVLANQGLCICVHSILERGAPRIFAGDGGAYIRCVFRVIIFRPFPSEILRGKVYNSDVNGIYVNVDFFAHIRIPPDQMQENSVYSEADKCWIWQYAGNELLLENGSEIIVKVMHVEYAPFNSSFTKRHMVLHDATSSANPSSSSSSSSLSSTSLSSNSSSTVSKVVSEKTTPEYIPPMLVVASIKAQGLGLREWWL
jgi:DNA-directed RNA polymerase III subunit RPC8